MYHDRLHVPNAFEALDHIFKVCTVVHSQEDRNSSVPFADCLHVQAWTEEDLTKCVLPLGCPGQVVEEAVYGQAFLRAGSASRWTLIVGVWMELALHDLQAGQGLGAEIPRRNKQRSGSY